jgi:protein SHQ1
MPIIPRFTLSQDETHVTIEIHVPHVRVTLNSVEVLVDGPVLHFSSPPYLLVLTFPDPFEEGEDSECAQYDPMREGGMVTLRLRKQVACLWRDLDLTGALMAPSRRSRAGAGISIVPCEGVSDSTSDSSEVRDDHAESSMPLPDLRNATRPRYGFLNQHSGIFTDLAREGLAAEMLQLPDPDETDTVDRRRLRLAAEDEAFDPNRYLGDLEIHDDYIYHSAFAMLPHWKDARSDSNVEDLVKSIAELSVSHETDQKAFFTEEESAQLASIAYPLLPETISSTQDDSLLMGLVDILFAYVYDHLSTDGDPTIESSWTICTLSCTLSWLEEYNPKVDTFESVVQYSSRRALIYPYLRNLDLIQYCWDQAITILQRGRRCIIRCLLQVRQILDQSECHYLGNRLFVDHYLAWLQRHVTDTQITGVEKLLAREITKGIDKDVLGLDLAELERRLLVEGDDDSGENDSEDDGSSKDDSDSESSESNDDSSDSSSSSASESGEREDANADDKGHCLVHSDELLDSNLGDSDAKLRLQENWW